MQCGRCWKPEPAEGVSYSTVVVTDGLIPAEAGYAPHPALQPWLKRLQRARRRWFATEMHTPLGWYAWLQHEAPAALLASALPVDLSLPFEPNQYWAASPCSLQLSRDRVRVMPEVWLDFDARDAQWLCETLNPLLHEDTMQLVAIGSALCLCSGRSYDVNPVDFADVNGRMLPNTTPTGVDGGAWMRLQAEIQMLLHQHQPPHRSGQSPLHSLWLWGGADHAASTEQRIPVATQNATLASIVDGRDSSLCISEAEGLEGLLNQEGRLPRHWLLAGEAHAAWLTTGGLPGLRGKEWQPQRQQPGEALRGMLL